MYLYIKLILLILLTSCLSFGSNKLLSEYQKGNRISTPIECGDLLTRYAKKLAKLSFVDCASGKGQVILEAKYRVLGKDSKAVEAFLVENYGLGKLKFVCCGWESEKGRNGQINTLKGLENYPNYSITISMFASAEKELKEKETALEFDRNKIGYFTVLVQIVEV